jgi:hypothetical protein
VRLNGDGGSGVIAGRAVLNTLLGGALGGLATLATLYKFDLGIDIAYINNGVLSGLVSVTAGCATFQPWQAAITASVAGPLHLATSILLVKLHVDDVLDATAVHLSCGIWGVLSTGLFPSPESVRFVYGAEIESCGAFYLCDNGKHQLANQILYTVAILLWVGVTSFTLFYTMKSANCLRESFEDEVQRLYVPAVRPHEDCIRFIWSNHILTRLVLTQQILTWSLCCTNLQEVGIDIARHNGEAYQIQPGQPNIPFPDSFNEAGYVPRPDATLLASGSSPSSTSGSEDEDGDTESGTGAPRQALQAPVQVPTAADSDI